MSKGHCQNEDCNAAITNKCHLGSDSPPACPYWKANAKAAKATKNQVPQGKYQVPWTGEELKVMNIEQVSRRSRPLIIGVVGPADAGKTSFLGAVFTLLLNGRFLNDFSFAGSDTLKTWEYLAKKLRFARGAVSFPPPTPSYGDYYSFLHLALKSSDQRLHDVLFADAPGEVFMQWAADKQDPNADNVRWIHKNADAFILFVNLEVIAEKRMAGVSKTLDLASRLSEELAERPVVIAQSKADKLESVKPEHLARLDRELSQLFPKSTSFAISNFLDVNQSPDPKSLSNLHLLNTLLRNVTAPTMAKMYPPVPADSKDLFISYRGK